MGACGAPAAGLPQAALAPEALPPRPEAPPGQAVPKAMRSRPPRRGLQPRPLRAPWSATGPRFASRSLGCRRPLDALPARPPIRAAPRPVCRGRSGSANRPGRLRWLSAALPSETLASSLASGFVASRNAQSPRSGPTSPRHRIMAPLCNVGVGGILARHNGVMSTPAPGRQGRLTAFASPSGRPRALAGPGPCRERLAALRHFPSGGPSGNAARRNSTVGRWPTAFSAFATRNAGLPNGVNTPASQQPVQHWLLAGGGVPS